MELKFIVSTLHKNFNSSQILQWCTNGPDGKKHGDLDALHSTVHILADVHILGDVQSASELLSSVYLVFN